MSTPIPIADGTAGPGAWMPDEAALSRLASEIYGPLDGAGQVSEAASPVPPDGFGPGDGLPVTPNLVRQFQSGIAMPSVPGFDVPGMPGPSGRLPAPAPGPVSVTAPAGAAMRLESLIPEVLPPAPWELADGAAQPAAQPGSPVFYFITEAVGLPGPDRPDVPAPAEVARPLDVDGVRRDFPILTERVNGRPLVWMDNAATT